jgi:prepilin-type N-terminal cleavage/methylation domain-containing protein
MQRKTDFDKVGNCCSRNGFTLVEVLIAMVILSIGLLGMAGLLIGTIHTNKISRDMSIATVLAKTKIEELRRFSYIGLATQLTPKTEDYGTISEYPRFKRVTTLSSVSGAPKLYGARVAVFWGWQGTHFVEQKTILAGE